MLEVDDNGNLDFADVSNYVELVVVENVAGYLIDGLHMHLLFVGLLFVFNWCSSIVLIVF